VPWLRRLRDPSFTLDLLFISDAGQLTHLFSDVIVRVCVSMCFVSSPAALSLCNEFPNMRLQ
jgi:hypothetical protein